VYQISVMPDLRLTRNGADVRSVFDLLGTLETDMTAALGYAIARSSSFAETVMLRATEGSVSITVDTAITLELSRQGEGRTDIEIAVPGRALVVIEAKRGIKLPTREQLQLYIPRLQRAKGVDVRRTLLLVTAASPSFAHSQLRGVDWPGVTVVHISWAELAEIAHNSARTIRGHHQRVAKEYAQYLSRDDDMGGQRSNMVYVVALASGHREGWGLSWKDIVRQHSRYFYPIGKTWPETPPNYIAFRYGGQLQSIHHVDSYNEFTRPHDLFPAAADEEWEPHYCLTLGPPMRPVQPVRAGASIQRAARVWCMLDTLLTSATISEALYETKRRLNESMPSAAV